MRRAAGIAGLLAAWLAAALPVVAQDGGIAAPGLSPDASQARPNDGDGALMVETPEGLSAAPIMTIDQNGVFLRSRWGLRAKAATETRMGQINSENERLVSQFAAEEQELTLLRATLPPDEFRQKADDFDKRVSQARRDTERVNDELDAAFQAERTAFFRAALPVLARIMREHGAFVVLDQSAIFVAAQSVDVTEELIQRVNDEIGAGPAAEAAPAPALAPEAPAAPVPAIPQTP